MIINKCQGYHKVFPSGKAVSCIQPEDFLHHLRKKGTIKDGRNLVMSIRKKGIE